MKKDAKTNRDELTEKMHSEFTISKEKEIAIKVMLALKDMKEFKYTVAQVCELYGLTQEEIKIVEQS